MGSGLSQGGIMGITGWIEDVLKHIESYFKVGIEMTFMHMICTCTKNGLMKVERGRTVTRSHLLLPVQNHRKQQSAMLVYWVLALLK